MRNRFLLLGALLGVIIAILLGGGDVWQMVCASVLTIPFCAAVGNLFDPLLPRAARRVLLHEGTPNDQGNPAEVHSFLEDDDEAINFLVKDPLRFGDSGLKRHDAVCFRDEPEVHVM